MGTKKLKQCLILAATGVFCLLHAPGQAQGKTSQEELELLRQQVELLKQQNQQLNQRISEMEKKLETQQIQAAPEHVAAHNQNMIEREVARQIEEKRALPRINEYVSFSGLIEGDFILDKDFGGTHGSSFELSTMELYIDAAVTPWATGRIVIEYDPDEDDNKLRIDEAHITLGNTDEFPLFLNAGLLYVPFGDFSTNMLQDPLTQTLGEINDAGAIFGFSSHGFTGSVFAYNGMDKDDPDNDTINGFGVSLAYGYEDEDKRFNAGAAWVSNIADSVEMSDVVKDNIRDNHLGDDVGLSDEIPAMALYANGAWGPWSVITEYIRALDSFDVNEFAIGDKGAEPAALNVEFAYTTELWDLETVFALGYQRSWEALALDLPKHRYIGAASFVILSGTTLSFEYYYDKNYSERDLDAGDNGYGFTTRLAYEF